MTREPAADTATSRQEAERSSEQERLEERVHVDLPRVRPEDMVTMHDVDPPADPEGGRDTERDFVIRYGGGGI